jgi:hypothetical protein
MAVACVLLLGASAQAQVLEQLPEDAQIVIRFKNLQGINAKVVALAQRLGLAQMQPQFQDPLGSLMDASSVKNGVDKAGDVAIVFTKIPFAPTDPGEPTILVLVPVTNYQALLGNFGDKKKDGDLDVVHMPNDVTDLFVADWGKFAALSNTKEAIKKGTGLKLSNAIRKEMDAKDVSVYANVKAIGAIVLPIMRSHKAEILQNVADALKDAPNGNANLIPVAQAAVTQLLNGAEHVLSECPAAVLSGNLSDDGINFAVVADFTAGSYLGVLMQGVRNIEGSFTAGLPEGKYIAYGGGTINGAQAAQLVDDIVGPILAELTKASPDKAKVANTYLQGMRTVLNNSQMESVGLLAPSGALGQTSLVQGLAIVTGDAGKVSEGQKIIMAATQDFMKIFADAGVSSFKSTTTITPDAKTISGVSFSLLQNKMEAAENDPAAQQAAQMMAMMYGPSGVSVLLGKVDDKHLLSGTCVDDATMTAAIAAIQANADPLGKLAELQLVNKNLPQKRAAALYLSLDVLANTVVDYMSKFGLPIPPLQLKPNLPPVGFTAGTEGSAFRGDCFVPTDLLESLVAAGMQMQMKMRNPPQPNGAGGPVGM